MYVYFSSLLYSTLLYSLYVEYIYGERLERGKKEEGRFFQCNDISIQFCPPLYSYHLRFYFRECERERTATQQLRCWPPFLYTWDSLKPIDVRIFFLFYYYYFFYFNLMLFYIGQSIFEHYSLIENSTFNIYLYVYNIRRDRMVNQPSFINDNN